MSLAKPVPPIQRAVSLDRGLPRETAKTWLQAGWRDFKETNMEASLLYGIVVFLLSAIVIGGIFVLDADYILLPALAAFMVIGPALAVGLYEKSRRIESGEPVSIGAMLLVRAQSRGQIVFIGLLLTLWVLLWLRAGVLFYALFFGLHDFPAFGNVLGQVFTHPSGWALLIVGSLVGALFAAFAFAISIISVPMLLNEKTDAFTAMGASISLTWHNLPVMLTWGFIVMVLFVICLLTGLLALIVVFPVLGHGTWHVYRSIRLEPGTPIMVPAIPDSAVTHPDDN